MATIASLDTLIGDVDDTASGLIEQASLMPILNAMRDLIQERCVIPVDSVADLQATSNDEGNIAIVENVGTFIWEAGATYNYTTTFPAAGGGRWRRQLGNLAGLPSYANNAAALAGGLVAGDPYRSGDQMMITH